jgi:hypothetical protein
LSHDNCDKIGHGRHVDRDLRVGFRCSDQDGSNLETNVKGKEVHRHDHRFCLPAGLLTAQRNPEHTVPTRSNRRPFGSKRLILAN